MDDLNPTYAFEDGMTYALLRGQVIASGEDADAVVEEATRKVEAERDVADQERLAESKRTATHVVTPNGLRGELLGRVASTFGEQVTVRFENGHIVTLPVTGGEQWENATSHKVANSNPVAELEARLDSDYEVDRDSLSHRREELTGISRTARTLLSSGVSYVDEHKLHTIVVRADAENAEVRQTLEHLEQADAEAFRPPAPFSTQVVEQETVGVKSDGTWLDATLQDMVDEASATDFEKLLAEEPALFTAELPDGTLESPESTQDMARDYVSSKVAAFEGDTVDQFVQIFVARVEAARRAELESRKVTETRKEAATDEDESFPDEALFS